MTEATSRSQFKQRLASGETVVAPGVHDAMTALVAEQAGFKAVYLSGAAVAYNRLGRSDIGLCTFTEMVDTLNCISDRVSTPIIVDADTGFGGPMNVQRTVRGLERAGAAMIQLEDQSFPKRCGHLLGKVIVPVGEMCGKLKAALDARTDASTLIMARTDSVTVEGLDAALERAERYLECGVDALFVETLQTREHLEIAGKRFGQRVPLLANMVEGGRAPLLGADELSTMGYRIVIYPGGTSRYLVHAMQTYFKTLYREGTTESMLGSMLGFQPLNDVIGTPELLRIAEQYDPQAASKPGSVPR